jgi:ribosomal-protein-alanine N-acetyltransferase
MEESVEVPELAAEGGFRLRGWQTADLALVAEAATDPYIPLITTVPVPYSRREGLDFVTRQWERVTSGAGYPFVIVGDDGRALGTVGLWLRNLPQGRASLGYWVVPSARGRGAAGIGLRAVAAWAQDELGVPRLELYVEPWNAASMRTAQSAGFAREGLLRSWMEVGGSRRDMYLYARVKA